VELPIGSGRDDERREDTDEVQKTRSAHFHGAAPVELTITS
jgi:hypothetical protein